MTSDPLCLSESQNSIPEPTGNTFKTPNKSTHPKKPDIQKSTLPKTNTQNQAIDLEHVFDNQSSGEKELPNINSPNVPLTTLTNLGGVNNIVPENPSLLTTLQVSL